MMLKKMFFLIIIYCGISTNSLAQFEWAASMGGANGDFGNSVITDAFGNVCITGIFNDTVDFDPGTGISNLISSGMSDAFVQKLDNTGNLLWIKSFGGSLGDEGHAISVNLFGDVYVSGLFQGIVDFDPGPGITNLGSTGVLDMFVLKLNANGNFLWAKAILGNTTVRGYSITVDVFGDVYLTGEFRGTVDFDPGIGVTNITSNGSQDIFVLKLDLNGNMVWAKSMGGLSDASANSISTDGLGDLYITGYFRETVDFDPGSGVTNITATVPSAWEDIFVLKLNTSGGLVWVKSTGGVSGDRGVGISAKTPGAIYVTGYFRDTVDFDFGIGVAQLEANGVQDVFVQKLDVNGNMVWAKSMGGASSDRGNAIGSDALGNTYVTGEFSGNVDFDPGIGITILSSSGGFGGFIQKLDANGSLVWTKAIGEGFSASEGESIAVGVNGNIFITGYFSGILDFDPGAGITTKSSNGSWDVFVLKFGGAVGLGEMNNNFYLNIYPNPTFNQITIDNKQLKIIELKLRDISGKLIETINPTRNTVDLSGLPSGIYFLQITTAETTTIQKFIKN